MPPGNDNSSIEHSLGSVLQRAAVASGLVSQQQLEDALAGLSDNSVGHPPAHVCDDKLADRLVEFGYLNLWQAEQLKAGHTNFKLGPYKIVDSIGKGGMGHVFKGEHKLLGRIEAVKVLPKSKSSPAAIASFQREIRLQAQLDHPNLVRVSFAGYEGDTYFLVTEYVPGTDLRRLVRRHGPLSAAIAATIIAQTARGLAYAHRKGMVHRDIKPGNVLVTSEGRAKLTDLGLAWFLMEDLEPAESGRAASVVGTADYLAPESLLDPTTVRPVSDIYALGCTLYYAVTGKVPFPGGNTADKLQRHLEQTPLNPLHFNPELAEDFCDLIATLMCKDPNRRVQTAAQVVDLLLPWSEPEAVHELGELADVSTSRSRVSKSSRVEQQQQQQLDETAVYDLDEIDASSGTLESVSQLSQWTASISAANQETQREVRVAAAVTARASLWRRIGRAAGWATVGTVVVMTIAAVIAFWTARGY